MSASIEAAPPPVGHNKPPAPLTAVEVTEYLREECAALITRKDALVAAIGRFDEAHPSIDDEETQGKAADFVRQLKAHVTLAENRREQEKRPFLDGGRAVDAFFKGVKEPLEGGVRGVLARMTAYANRLEADRRRRAAAEAARTAEAARQAAAEAAATMAPAALDTAAHAAAHADAAAQHAAAAPAEHSRTYGEYGAVSSLRRIWKWEEVDKLALIKAIVGGDEKPPRLDLLHLLVIDGPAVNRMIVGGECQAIPGLRVYPDTGVQVR